MSQKKQLLKRIRNIFLKIYITGIGVFACHKPQLGAESSDLLSALQNDFKPCSTFYLGSLETNEK